MFWLTRYLAGISPAGGCGDPDFQANGSTVAGQRMRRIFYGLGIAFVVLLVAAAGGIGYIAYVGGKLDKQAQAYVDEAVPRIVAEWSADELQRRASPEFLHATKPDDLRSLFVLFAKLGPLIQYGGAKGQATIYASAGAGKRVTASYVAQATFKNGAATIEITLRRIDGVWRVDAFRVNSPALIEAVVGRPI
jgi:hypothetical protein